MSEFHPNRTKMVRKPQLTARRILECWPVLVWIAVGFIAFKSYSSGVVFTRMNGAVDPYQENITPLHDGTLAKILVHRGQRVAPNAIVAQMNKLGYYVDLEGLHKKVIEDRKDNIIKSRNDLIRLESDLREIDRNNGEDKAVIKALAATVADQEKQIQAARDAARGKPLPFTLAADQKSVLDYHKAKAREEISTGQATTLRKQVEELQAIVEKMTEDALKLEKLDLNTADIIKSGALRGNEVQEFKELQTKIELCDLRATKGGIIDRIEKEEGEYTGIGESVLKIVGDPTQILCFLPQDQMNKINIGQEVWIASTSDKALIFKSTIEGISPRVNNLADSTSPLPGQVIHGRDVLIKYPPEALPKTTDAPYLLLPGQTLIIHLDKPGGIPLIDQIFHNDDSNPSFR